MDEKTLETDYQVQALRVELQVAHAQLIECQNFIDKTEKNLQSYDFTIVNQYNEARARLKQSLTQIDADIKSRYYAK